MFVTKLMDGVNLWLQNRSGDENCYCRILAFAYNLEYLLQLTKLKHTDIFIVDFHGSRIYQFKEKNHVFHHDVLLLWNVFAVLNLMLKDLTVRLLIEKTTLLEEKNLFSL